MLRQIYHTSHCGSTLLAFLVSYNNTVYNEPDWFYQYMGRGDGVKGLNKMSEYNERDCIKFPSLMCHFAPITKGKKVFIYRTLEDHLQDFCNNCRTYMIYGGYLRDFALENLHESLKGLWEKCDNDLKKTTLFWANNFAFINDAENVMYIDSKDFFKDKRTTIKKVLSHFDIQEKDKNYNLSLYSKRMFDPKSGLFVSREEKEWPDVPEDYGIVYQISDKVNQTVEWWNEIVNRR